MKDYVFLNLYFVLVMKSHLESYPCPLIIKAFPKDIAALDKRSVLAKVNSHGSGR